MRLEAGKLKAERKLATDPHRHTRTDKLKAESKEFTAEKAPVKCGTHLSELACL